ncbi:MAG TPA: PD-(D/E)XK nuclease family protein [Candidatus Dadabacteria bacterium]|nr:PD-(D/E)XK nuclease family protein [Candidatus Dadabacteria bacterium]
MWSFSRLGTFLSCKRQFKYRYIDKISYDEAYIEAFMGNIVHETLDRLYQELKIKELIPLEKLEALYDRLWHEKFVEYKEIKIVKEDRDYGDYYNIGLKCIENYYNENLESLKDPKFKFIYTETNFRTANILPKSSKMKVAFTGKVDRIDVYDDRIEIHDYKTSESPPTELDINTKFDYRQLPIYKKLLLLDYRFEGVKEIKVVWHFLRHRLKYEKIVKDEELEETVGIIEKIVKEENKEQEYIPTKSMLCNWCSYMKICPLFSNKELVDKNSHDPDIQEGPRLTRSYIELKKEEKEIKEKINDIKEKLVAYSEKFSGEPMYTIESEDKDQQVTIKHTIEKRIPSSGDPLRDDLEKRLKEKGVWDEFSMLSSRSINSKMNKENLSDEMQEFFDMYTEDEKVVEIRQSKVKKK